MVNDKKSSVMMVGTIVRSVMTDVISQGLPTLRSAYKV